MKLSYIFLLIFCFATSINAMITTRKYSSDNTYIIKRYYEPMTANDLIEIDVWRVKNTQTNVLKYFILVFLSEKFWEYERYNPTSSHWWISSHKPSDFANAERRAKEANYNPVQTWFDLKNIYKDQKSNPEKLS